MKNVLLGLGLMLVGGFLSWYLFVNYQLLAQVRLTQTALDNQKTHLDKIESVLNQK